MATTKIKTDGTKAVFKCRLSYAHLEEPFSMTDDAQKKFSVCCLIDKNDQDIVEGINKAIDAAKKQGVVSKAGWKGKVPATLKNPFRDGDEEKEDDESFNGMFFLNASSKKAVPVFNKLMETIDPQEAYSGCYAMVSVNFFPYDSAGSKGIGAGLNAVVKMQDGERLGGAGNPKKDFDGIDFGLDVDLDNL